jgi:hypothetical protein
LNLASFLLVKHLEESVTASRSEIPKATQAYAVLDDLVLTAISSLSAPRAEALREAGDGDHVFD